MTRTKEMMPLQRLAASAKGWSLNELSKQSGVELWKIRYGNLGYRRFTADEARRLARTLGVATSSLPRFDVVWK